MSPLGGNNRNRKRSRDTRVACSDEAFEYYDRLKRVKRHLEGHISEDFSLTAAARVAGIEKTYFSTFFHQKTGVCFKDWNAAMRIDRAVEMMGTRNHSITNIALSVGFRDLRTFERTFKRHTGTTPRDYKNSIRPG